MGIGVSVFLLALGGILAWGVNVDDTQGFNINTIGMILMAVGVIGLIVSLTIFGRGRSTTVVEEREVV